MEIAKGLRPLENSQKRLKAKRTPNDLFVLSLSETPENFFQSHTVFIQTETLVIS